MSIQRSAPREIWIAVIGAAAFISAACGASAADAPAVVARWNLGGEGGWDYLTLDPSGARLFVSRGTRVDVIDTMSGKIAGSIANTTGVHGIALAGDLNRGYTSNGRSDSVTAFDLNTLRTIQEAHVPGKNPDAIVYDAPGKHVFTFNGRSKDADVLDADSLTLVRTIPMPDKPEFAVDDDNGTIFVNIESEQGQLVAIDTRKLAVRATWKLPGCASPSGLALDKIRHRLFSVCDGKVMVVTDALTGAQVDKVAIGDGPDAAAFDSRRQLAFSSNGEGTLSIIREDGSHRYAVAHTVPTMRGARTMALDPSAGKVYLVSADFDPAPAATPEQPHPRPVPKAGTFTVLVVSLQDR